MCACDCVCVWYDCVCARACVCCFVCVINCYSVNKHLLIQQILSFLFSSPLFCSTVRSNSLSLSLFHSNMHSIYSFLDCPLLISFPLRYSVLQRCNTFVRAYAMPCRTVWTHLEYYDAMQCSTLLNCYVCTAERCVSWGSIALHCTTSCWLVLYWTTSCSLPFCFRLCHVVVTVQYRDG